MENYERMTIVRKIHFCFACGLPFYRVPMHAYRQSLRGAKKYICASCVEINPDYWPTRFGQMFPSNDEEWLELMARWEHPRMEGFRPLLYHEMMDGHLILLSDAIERICNDEVLRHKLAWDYSYQFVLAVPRRDAWTAVTTDGATITTTPPLANGEYVWVEPAVWENQVPLTVETGGTLTTDNIGTVDDRMYITHVDPPSMMDLTRMDPGMVETVTPINNGRLPTFMVGSPVYLGENGTLTHVAPPEANNTTGLVVGHVIETTAEVEAGGFRVVRSRIALREPGTRPTIPV